MVRTIGTFVLLVILLPSSAPAQTTKATRKDQDRIQALLVAHNKVREAAKLPPLSLDPKLNAAALVQATDMAEHDMMSHDGSDGSKFNERIDRQGYRYRAAAENVAAGQKNTAQVMKSWMNSPHHKENILGPYTQVGFGVARNEEGVLYSVPTSRPPGRSPTSNMIPTGVVEALNHARAAAGREPLELNPKLVDAAASGAKTLAASESDKPESPSKMGETMLRQIKKSGYQYRALAQLTAAGQSSPAEVAKMWLDSPQQKKTILGDFSEVGVGVAASEKGVPYWYLILGSPIDDH